MKKNVLLMVLCTSVILAACGKTDDAKNNTNNTVEKPKEPFTMTIFTAGVSADEFNDRFRQAIEKKFPHITFEYKVSGAGQTITDLISTGNIPDLIRTDIPTLLTNYLDLQLGEDLNPYVKKYSYDLSRFNKVFIDEILDSGRTGELYGMPVPPFFPQVLYYNKDLFDRFAVPYPKDGMTWDEVYEVAKKMTRVDGSEVYRGFSSSYNALLRDNPYSQPILDPNSDSLSGFDRWASIFNNFKRFYEITNNKVEANVTLEGNIFGKGKVAMQANQHNVYLIIPPEVNWDIVSAPTFAGGPKLMGQRGPAYWSIAKTSKHKDEAFQVIMEMLSDEIQLADSKKGIPTTLNKPEIQTLLGKEHPIYSTKNMKAVSYYQPNPYTPKRKVGLADVAGGTQTNLLGAAFFDVISGKTDTNTSLKLLDEKLKQEIEKAKAK